MEKPNGMALYRSVGLTNKMIPIANQFYAGMYLDRIRTGGMMKSLRVVRVD